MSYKHSFCEIANFIPIKDNSLSCISTHACLEAMWNEKRLRKEWCPHLTHIIISQLLPK